MFNLPTEININDVMDLLGSQSFKTIKLIFVIYIGLLWLSVIIWVTRDAIQRSDSLIFQVIAIMLNIVFPILGIFLYLIIRPGKTTTERYYEDLEHRLILESIGENETEDKTKEQKKPRKKEDKKT